MTRIEGVPPDAAKGYVARVYETQTKTWGAPLLNHRIYARRPALFKGMRGMWNALNNDEILDENLVALVNRRVALLNGCVF